MDEAIQKSGEWPNVAIPAGTPANVARNQYEARRAAQRCEGEHTPADVENRPQDGLECDTREKVLADLERLAHEWHDYDGNFMRIYNHVAYAQVKELLDRQAAITERECIDQHIADQIGSMWKDEKVRKLQDQVDSLTAERD